MQESRSTDMGQPGRQKPHLSGRKPGTPNKRTLMRIDVEQILTSKNYDPIADVIDQLALIENPVDRAQIALKLAEFVFPKRKAVEHTGQIDINSQQVVIMLPSNGREIIQPKTVESLPQPIDIPKKS